MKTIRRLIASYVVAVQFFSAVFYLMLSYALSDVLPELLENQIGWGRMFKIFMSLEATGLAGFIFYLASGNEKIVCAWVNHWKGIRVFFSALSRKWFALVGVLLMIMILFASMIVFHNQIVEWLDSHEAAVYMIFVTMVIVIFCPKRKPDWWMQV